MHLPSSSSSSPPSPPTTTPYSHYLSASIDRSFCNIEKCYCNVQWPINCTSMTVLLLLLLSSSFHFIRLDDICSFTIESKLAEGCSETERKKEKQTNSNSWTLPNCRMFGWHSMQIDHWLAFSFLPSSFPLPVSQRVSSLKVRAKWMNAWASERMNKW